MFKTKYIFTEVDNFFGGSKEDEDEVDDGIDDDLEDVDDTEPVEDDTEILVDEDQPQTKPSRRIKLMRIISSLYWQVSCVGCLGCDLSLREILHFQENLSSHDRSSSSKRNPLLMVINYFHTGSSGTFDFVGREFTSCGVYCKLWKLSITSPGVPNWSRWELSSIRFVETTSLCKANNFLFCSGFQSCNCGCAVG